MIHIRAARQDGRVALWERHPDHPHGEVFVAGDAIVPVARTALVNQKIAIGDIVIVPDSPAPEGVTHDAPDAIPGDDPPPEPQQTDAAVAQPGDAAATEIVPPSSTEPETVPTEPVPTNDTSRAEPATKTRAARASKRS